jgi:hypothetical protein
MAPSAATSIACAIADRLSSTDLSPSAPPPRAIIASTAPFISSPTFGHGNDVMPHVRREASSSPVMTPPLKLEPEVREIASASF